MIFVIASLLVFLDIRRSSKLVLAAVLGLWVGMVAASSAAGWLNATRPFPVLGLFVAAPLIAATILAMSTDGRRAMLALPMSLLVGLNAGRILAILFLLLAGDGRMSGIFPLAAGWGDIITGVIALPLIASAAEPARNRTILFAWNLFGLADLVDAIVLGVTSISGSPLQIFAPPGSAPMQVLPWSFVPAVLVPLYMILHGIVFAQLRAVSPSVRAPG
jgi:hypothetical protein